MPPNQTAEADRGRHPGFPSFNVLAGGPGSLAERSAAEGGFTALALSMTAEERVRAVLRPGESLLWWGVPARRRFLSEMAAQVIFGAIPFTLGALLVGFAGWHLWRGGVQPADLAGNLFGGSVGLFFVGLGVYCFLYPLRMGSRLREVVYAVTDQRGLVLTSPRGWWNPVPALREGESQIEFSPDQLRGYKKKWRDVGRTDLILHKEWKRASRGGGGWRYFGFLGLDEPEEAERVIQQHYLAPGPPTQNNPAAPGTSFDGE